MKSTLLAARLRGIFGADGEAQLERLLSEAAPSHPVLVDGVRRLQGVADGLLAQFALVQRVQTELSGDAFADWNLSTGRIDSGKHWKSLLGYADADLADTLEAWRSLVVSEDLQRLDAALAAHVEGQTASFQAECRLRTRQGDWTWLLVKGAVVARDVAGAAARVLVLQRDISAFRKSESDALAAKAAAEAASRSRSAFLANMSHEIRTPMNGILGMTELALDTQLDAEQRHYLRTVKSSAESLLAIVNDILDFSKVEAGKLSIEQISFNLAQVVFESVRVQAISAQRKGIEVLVSLGENLPSRVIGDPTRLRQVIVNLVANAVKFTEHGEIEVCVELESSTDAGVTLRLQVRDSGIGIPVHRQQAIFDAFSQADDSTTRKYGGTGLGLAICSHLVELMGGRIWVESAEGQGASFQFTVRVGQDDGRKDVVWPPRLASKRVLLLTAHQRLATQLAGGLQATGAEVRHLADALEARVLLEKSRASGFAFDLVVVDGNMPPPGGAELVEFLAASSSGAIGVANVMMLLDGEQQRTLLPRLRELGVGAHLVKPVAPEDIFAALRLVFGSEVDSGLMLDPFDVEAQRSQSGGARIRALLVEDNPVNQELAERLLSKRGLAITLANDGAEAVDLFEQYQFDIVFMDMQMPVMDGLEATESIRSREMRRSWVVSEEFRPVYIVAMTANAMPGDRDLCLRAGMDDYIAKPIRPQELDAVMVRFMEYRGGDSEESLAVRSAALTSSMETNLDLAAAVEDLGELGLLLTMAKMLLGEWGQHVGRVQESLGQRDAAALSIDAHTLKSLLAIFHADKARRLALKLEEAAKAEDVVGWPLVQRRAEELLIALDQLKPEMERFVQNERIS